MPANVWMLSGLHLQGPETFVESARHLEALGYHRYWATEHHTPHQCPNPLLVAAAAAARTSTIRLGSAGVMLQYQSPRKIAEDLRVLRALAGPRIDLGLISTRVREPLHAALLDGRPDPDDQSFATKLRSFVQAIAMDASSDPDHATPVSTDTWICGQSVRTAELAGALGMGFAFRHQPAGTDGPGPESGKRALNRYLETFATTTPGREPRFVVACLGMCDTTHEAARDAWRAAAGVVSLGIEPPPPSFLGTPGDCLRQLTDLACYYRAPELVVDCLTRDPALRLRAFTLLSHARDMHTRPVAMGAPSNMP